MFDLAAIQSALLEFGIDGWLLYDFRGTNVLARRVLELADGPLGSRRVLYCIPARGAPRKLVHRIESGALDHLPGEKRVYLTWQEFEAGVQALCQGLKTVAMEYAPRASNPYIARVDAGTVELVKEFGHAVVPSGDLIQRFEATWSDTQWHMHQQASEHTRAAFDMAFDFIASTVKRIGEVHESAVVRRIADYLTGHGLVIDHDPIVAVGPHSGDPHYCTTPGSDAPIRRGDLVLIDLWGKLNKPGAVFSDLTRMAYVGESVPAKYEEPFQVIVRARDTAIARVREAFAGNQPLFGWQVDDAARQVIVAAGYGDRFVHRTGHSIGQEIHGNGANMDNLETRDARRVLRSTCFSVEPGIYGAEFGVRTEVDVFVDANGTVHVTGGVPQTHITPLPV